MNKLKILNDKFLSNDFFDEKNDVSFTEEHLKSIIEYESLFVELRNGDELQKRTKDLKKQFLRIFSYYLSSHIYNYPKKRKQPQFTSLSFDVRQFFSKFQKTEKLVCQQLINKSVNDNEKLTNQKLFDISFQTFIFYSIHFQLLLQSTNNNNHRTASQRLPAHRLWILLSLIKPIHHRFVYYFSNQQLASPDHDHENDNAGEELKYEYITSYIMNQISDHSHFLLLVIQPAFDYYHHCASSPSPSSSSPSSPSSPSSLSAKEGSEGDDDRQMIADYKRNIKTEFIEQMVIILNSKLRDIICHHILTPLISTSSSSAQSINLPSTQQNQNSNLRSKPARDGDIDHDHDDDDHDGGSADDDIADVEKKATIATQRGDDGELVYSEEEKKKKEAKLMRRYMELITNIYQFHQSLLLYHSYPPHLPSHIHRRGEDDGKGEDDKRGDDDGDDEDCSEQNQYTVCLDIFQSSSSSDDDDDDNHDQNHLLFQSFVRLHAAWCEAKIEDMMEDEQAMSSFYDPSLNNHYHSLPSTDQRRNKHAALSLPPLTHLPTHSAHFTSHFFTSLYQRAKWIRSKNDRSIFHHHVLAYWLDLYYHFIKEKKAELTKQRSDQQCLEEKKERLNEEMIAKLSSLSNSLDFCITCFRHLGDHHSSSRSDDNADHDHDDESLNDLIALFLMKYQKLLNKSTDLLLLHLLAIFRYHLKLLFSRSSERVCINEMKKVYIPENLAIALHRLRYLRSVALSHLSFSLHQSFILQFRSSFEETISKMSSIGYLDHQSISHALDLMK